MKKQANPLKTISSIDPIQRGVSGRIIKLKISGQSKGEDHHIVLESEYEIRRVLHPEFLYSSAFTINANSGINRTLDKITLSGAGWGHGVGPMPNRCIRNGIIRYIIR